MESAQITQIRLPNGKTIALVDWSDLPLFSTIDLVDGFTDQAVPGFTYVVSDQVASSANITTRRVATERDTNIAAPGSMASTEEMLVYNIKVEPHQFLLTTANTATTATYHTTALSGGAPLIEAQVLAVLQNRLLLQLEVTQKLFANAGLGYYNQGFGVVPSTAATGTAWDRSFGNQGIASADAPRSFTIPVHIGGQENYKVILANPDGVAVQFPNFVSAGTLPTTGTKLVQLRIYLEGLYKRPVS